MCIPKTNATFLPYVSQLKKKIKTLEISLNLFKKKKISETGRGLKGFTSNHGDL